MKEVRQKIMSAVRYIEDNVPYMVHAVRKLSIKPADVPTICTTKEWRTYYNIVWLMTLSADQIAGLLCHEVLHIILHHFERGDHCTDKHLANCAQDLVINQMLIEMHLPLPSNGMFLINQTFYKPGDIVRSWEYYYDLMYKKDIKPVKGVSLGNDISQTSVGSGECGSCAGEVGQGEIEADIANQDDSDLMNDLEKDIAIKEIIYDVLNEEKRSTAPGTEVSKTLRKIVKGYKDSLLVASQISWKKVLNKQINGALSHTAGASSMSLLRPSIPMLVHGFVRPGPIGTLPVPMIVFDTSGSMHGELLQKCLSETAGILKTIGVQKILVMDADNRVHDCKEVSIKQLRSYVFAGNGGTNFIPAIDAVSKMRPLPPLLIYMTDGFGLFPPKPPKFPVIWALISSDVKPPWGQRVYVK